MLKHKQAQCTYFVLNCYISIFSYIEFIEHSVELNNLSSFPQLTERSKSIGYNVSKVVFRGYFAHDKLQKLHDGAIELRTKLKIAVSYLFTCQIHKLEDNYFQKFHLKGRYIVGYMVGNLNMIFDHMSYWAQGLS